MSTALGIVNTIDMPSRQSIIIELVGKEDLMNAIALNSMVFNLARIIGPAIAGIVMGYAGIAICFFANAISFGAVLISLFFIKLNPVERKAQKNNRKVLEEIKDGLKYIYHKKILLNTILILAIIGTFVPNFNVLVPVFAKEILKQNEAGFGILMSFMGFGSFLGAMFIATLSKSGPKKVVIYIVPFIVAVSLIITGYTNVYILTGIFLAITGFFFITFTSSANSALQLNSSNEYRGRVMSVYTLVFAGSTPFGNLYAGLFAEHFNARIGFVACGAIIILLMIPLFIYKMKLKVT
jgi:MFS family permease